MTMNWNRQIQLSIGDRSLFLGDFDIEFEYNFNTDEEPNEIEVVVYNLAQTTINTYAQKGRGLFLNAGYEGDVGNISKGYIFESTTVWEGTDKITTISGFDATEEYLSKELSKAYAPGVTAMDVINDLTSQVGLTVGEIQLNVNVQYPRGISVTGKLRDILKQIVQEDCNTNLQIINGVITIRDIGQGLATGFVLGPTTGLIGSPEPINDTDDEDEDKKADYIIRCFLNHRIGCMTRIRIDSKDLKADAVVVRGTHRGSKDGDFITEMEVKLI